MPIEPQGGCHADTNHDHHQGAGDGRCETAQCDQRRHQSKPECCRGYVALAQSLQTLEQPRRDLARFARIAQELGQLPGNNHQSDTVQVAGQDRLRKETREKPEAGKPGHEIEYARHQRQHRQERQVTPRIALCQGRQTCRYHDAGGGISAR